MKKKVKEALGILADLGLPREQQNERSAMCLLALCGLKLRDAWSAAKTPLIGITPIMEFAAAHYRDEPYAPNTRETIRRQTMHQFCTAGLRCTTQMRRIVLSIHPRRSINFRRRHCRCCNSTAAPPGQARWRLFKPKGKDSLPVTHKRARWLWCL